MQFKNVKKTTLILLLCLFFLLSLATAQHNERTYIPETDPLVLMNLEEWQDMKFGLLMHWGAYSQWGIVESWSICAEDEEWCRRSMDDYTAYKKKYEGLKNTFNPVKFDPTKWAEAARNAGMRYMVFTTKHHDGFCMFDSKYTDYKVTDKECAFSSDSSANITKKIFDAFRNEDMWVGAYFSKPDWHSEYYWWLNFATPDRNVNYDPDIYPERWSKFVDYTHNQIMELMTGYGDVSILWLDGGWVAKQSGEDLRDYYNRSIAQTTSGFLKKRVINQDIKMDDLVEKARKKQPGLIVVDRAVPGKNQNYLTPENRVPEETLPYPWESCIIAGGGWSWVPDAKYKSGRELVHLLVDIVAKGGNLLLNIAPGPDGTWHETAYERLNEIAGWMEVNKEAIYSTRPIWPYKEGKVCLTRNKNNGAVYLMYLTEDGEDEPPSKIRISAVSPVEKAVVTMLGSNEILEWEKVHNGVVVNIPESIRKNPPCDYAWTIKISEIIKP
ncbi:MAG: alpha-L-fucosidase [Bacteroidetes bacterium]|nr:alpha-L-fucosidase [Bacteroidota bacterium]